MEKLSFKKEIKDARVTLKKHSLDLAETMFNYVDQDRERLRQFLPWVDHTKILEDEIGYIKHTHKSWDNHTLFDYGLFDAQAGTYMGNIGVHTISWEHNCCEIGYWILGKFEGQGHMSNALKALEKYVFELGFNRIEIRCSDLNERSANVPKYNGYTFEGELRQNAIELGKYRNTKIFSKLKFEYIKK